MLKLSLAGGTCAFFLNKRFSYFVEKNKYTEYFVILLSICYALSQYNIVQSCNVMWLDGVYLLPIILLGVYKLVHNEYMWKLSVPVALSILFNWYTGGINCLLSSFWFLLELFLYYLEKNQKFKGIKEIVYLFGKYIISVVMGILCSCILFIPTIMALQNSSKGSLQLNNLLNFSFIGDIPSIIQNYTYGAESSYGEVSLFCGMLPLIGVINFFVGHKNSGCYQKRRLILGGMLLLSILFYFWNPFFVMFSLLKDVTSYHYRVSAK